VNTREKYASVNVTAYRYLKILNVNTVKNSIAKMQINGKEENIQISNAPPYAYKIFNNVCITKIIQLADFGLQGEINGYLSLAQINLTKALYLFVKANGGKTKLKNYVILNYDHDFINYYLKVVGVINLIVVFKIILVLIMEKIKNVKT
jgi:hypothetical protein